MAAPPAGAARRTRGAAACAGRGPGASPGLVVGAFAIGYGLARSFCELFREPDAQLGFLWGGLTMGMLLSLPLMLAGIAIMVWALRQKPSHPS